MDGEGIAISQAADHTVDRRGRADDRALRRGVERRSGDLAARGNDELRDQIVPLNQKYPLTELLEACRTYPGLTNARRITFEYVMLKGVNDTPAEARELVRLLKGIPAKINLIPFNPWPGAPFECSDEIADRALRRYRHRAGYASPIRTPRGRTSWPPAAS